MDFLNRRQGLSTDALWKFTDLSTSVQKHLEQVSHANHLVCAQLSSLQLILCCTGVPDTGSSGAGGGKRCGRAEHPAHPTISLHGEARLNLKPLMLLEDSASGICCALQIGFAACSYFLASTLPNPKKMRKRCARCSLSCCSLSYGCREEVALQTESTLYTSSWASPVWQGLLYAMYNIFVQAVPRRLSINAVYVLPQVCSGSWHSPLPGRSSCPTGADGLGAASGRAGDSLSGHSGRVRLLQCGSSGQPEAQLPLPHGWVPAAGQMTSHTYGVVLCRRPWLVRVLCLFCSVIGQVMSVPPAAWKDKGDAL